MTLPLEAGSPCGREGFSGGDYGIDVYEQSLNGGHLVQAALIT
jgi:hypothetical protein